MLDIGVLAHSMEKIEDSVSDLSAARGFIANWNDTISKVWRTYNQRLGSPSVWDCDHKEMKEAFRKFECDLGLPERPPTPKTTENENQAVTTSGDKRNADAGINKR